MNLHRVVLRCSLLAVSLITLFSISTNGQVRPRVTEAVNDGQRVTLRGNVHPLARAEFDRGAVADAQPMKRILLLLKRSDEQEAALEALLGNQQDKSSPSYHQWLTPEQFGAQFGPADADVQKVTDWLTRQGFTIEKVYSGKTVVEFSGTAGQVQKAFGTSIHSYAVNGKTYSANASDPQIPAALAPVVTGVVSLHNFPRQFYSRRVGTVRRSENKSVLEMLDPLVTVIYQNLYGVGPGDFAKIYGTPATCGSPAVKCDGTGQTIAIVGETNLTVSDVQQFRSIFGLPANFDASSIVYNGEDPGITSTDEEGEALLDTQWSGGVAPGATIQYVLSASTSASQGVDLSALYIVEHNLPAVMSESYGACELDLGSVESSFVSNLWEQASAQGITVSVSSGDSGSAGCDDPNTEPIATHQPGVNGLASTPYNVAMGGTDFDEYGNASTYWSNSNDPSTGTSALGYIPEIPWNQSCGQLGLSGCNINTTPPLLQNIVAGGGGASTQYNRPSWQIGVAGTLSGDGKRDVPDVSLFSSPGFNGSGYLYCQSDRDNSCFVSSGFNAALDFGVIGGTSAAAPAFAGIMALVNQSQATAQNPTPRQGNANYILYALANKAGASCASKTPVGAGCVFNDIVAGSSALPSGGKGVGTIDVPCQYPTLDCNATSASLVGVLESPANPTTMAWNVAPGYDMASGLGSLNIGNLITAWGGVSSVPTTTTLTLNPTTGITHGSESVKTTISVAPKSGTATGSVSLIASPTAGSQFGVGRFTLGSGGNATGNVVNLPGGSNYQVHAHYSGDGTNAPSDSAPVTVSVAQETSKTFIVVPTYDSNGNEISANASSIAYGSSYIVRVYVTNSAGTANAGGAPTGACSQGSGVTCPSGTVALTANGNPVDGGTFNLNDIGYTRDIAPTLPGGTTTIAAAYSGDSSYSASQTSEGFTVTPASTTLNPPYTPGGAAVGQPVALSALLTSHAYSGVAPTGTVTFYDGTTALTGPVTLSPTAPSGTAPGQLQALINPTFTTTGSHSIIAKYSGDTNYAAATSTSLPLPVFYTTSMSLNASTTAVNYGQSIAFTAVLTTQGKGPAITGQIQIEGPGSTTFTNITSTPGTDANGNQMLTLTAMAVVQNSGVVFASYPGDTNYEGASSGGLYINVNVPDFSMSPANGLSIAPTAGQPGSGQFTITPQSQVPSTVTVQFFPNGAPPLAGYNVTLTPQPVSLNGSPVTVSINLIPVTSAPGTASLERVHRAGLVPLRRNDWWSLSLAAALFAGLLLAYPGRRKRIRAALGLSVIGLLFLVIGCGGGGGSNGGGAGGGGGGGGNGGGGGGTPNVTSVTLTTSNPKVALNGQLSVVATITGGKNPTGTITFYDYGTPLAAAFPLSSAQPSIEIGTNYLWFPGVHQLTAAYSGDPNNLASTSSTLTQTVTGTLNIEVQGTTGPDTHWIEVALGVQ
jgi:subtilase family serine protease